jgi:hypothetical protein
MDPPPAHDLRKKIPFQKQLFSEASVHDFFIAVCEIDNRD